MRLKSSTIILSCICLAAGFILSVNLFGLKTRSYTVQADDIFYVQPTVTADICKDYFETGSELVVVERIELSTPTAVKMAKDLMAEDAERVKYKLCQGDIFKLVDAAWDKGNNPCIIEVQTIKGQKAKLKVDKSAVLPLDEGIWLNVKNSQRKTSGWVRVKTNWY